MILYVCIKNIMRIVNIEHNFISLKIKKYQYIIIMSHRFIQYFFNSIILYIIFNPKLIIICLNEISFN